MQSTQLHSSIPKWQTIIVAATISAIILHLGLWFFGAAQLQNIPLLIIIIVGGLPFIFQIAIKVFSGDFGADMLAVIAIIVSVILQQYLTAALVILMLSGGQSLESYAMRKASSALFALAERMPANAHRKKGKLIEDIKLCDIKIGDIIVIYPHETCPIDGIVTSGHSNMDESYLTGEPYHISKAPGASVISGAINGDSMLVVKAEKLASDSRYTSIMKVIEEAGQKRPKMRRLGDSLGAIFAPIALALAFLSWYLSGEMIRFLAVLVIATPCPLLISIPITIISAISIAAKRGIIIKDPTILELLPICRTAIFDKTGTLTYGKPKLIEIIVADGVDKDEILQEAASLERYSKHPLAYSILKAAEKAKLSLMHAENVSEKPGKGLMGKLNGREIRITHSKAIAKLKLALPKNSRGLECIVLRDSKYAATFRFIDMPREGSKSFISHLGPSHKFNKIMLISGDRESEVRYLGDLLGIKETLSSQSPEQKLATVEAEVAKALTLFMGDGINDAPALTLATVGIAFGQYNSKITENAGAVIMKKSLVKVDELIHISENMRKIALQSAIGGILLSMIGMGFAAFGYITPIAGALIQEGIDVISILYSLKLTWSSSVKTDYQNHTST